MMTIETWVRTPVSEALGWALFHSLWQGAIAAALLAVMTAHRHARVRYLGGCAALAAIVLSFAFTFWLSLPPDGIALRRTGLSMPIALVDASPGKPAAWAFYAGDLLAWLTPLWLMGVAFFQLRMVRGWLGTRRLRHCGLCDVPASWKARAAELAARMRVVRPVELLESGLTAVPVVMGHLRPAILLPAGLLAAMPPEQIEAILLHELAHIRRHDYLVNLWQAIAEGLLFYHPAVWWISGRIREEREHCCDDLAVTASSRGGAYEYALALAALEESRWGEAPKEDYAGAIAATGGKLVKRIHRLLYPSTRPAPATGWATTPLMLVLVLASAAALVDRAAAQPPPQTEPHLKWVNEDVIYIIEPREREAYVRLKTTEEREKFVEQFWLRRATNGKPVDEVRKEHYRRIAYSNERFRSPAKVGWKTDRGRIYIVHGPPDEIEAHPSGRAGGPPSQRWLYRQIEGIGERVIVEFLDGNRDGEYRQTTDPAAKK